MNISNNILVKESIEFDKLTFETAKNYNHFFPHNNIEIILQKLDVELQRKLKRRKTFKRIETNFSMIEKKFLDITFQKEKYNKKYKIGMNSCSEKNIDKSERKEILTKVKIIRILKEIEKRKNRRKGPFYRIKNCIKSI